MALNLENKGLEYSPFAERSKEAASRRFSKRKCSKSLLDMFERESSSHLENDATNDTLFNKQNLSVLPEESPNMDHCLNLNKRFKSLGTNNNSNSFRLIEWENPNNVSFTSQISLPPDWDDSAARSSFDSPFMPKESVNKRISNVYPVDFSHLNDICPTKGKVSSQQNAKSHSAQLPRDMRLGTKLRLVSERPFPWLEKIGTPGVYPVNPYIPSCDYEEAMNTIKLVDQKREQNQIKSNDITNPSANALVLLQSATIFHQCPSVGSVQMFPRRNVDSKSTLKSANLQSIEANFMEDLTRQWLEAFDFLFQTWLSGKRKCFYLCSPQFTIYFSSEMAKPKQQKMHRPMAKTPTKTPQKVKNNSAEKKTPKGKENCGTPNQKKILTSPFVWAKSPPRPSNLQESTEGEQQQQQQPLIVLTPTSTGFRQILHKNGVDFSLPFKPEFVDLSQELCPKDFLPNEEDQSAQMDHDEWLKDIGISPRTTLRLRQSASELDAQQTQTNDGNSSSAGSGRVPSNPSPPTEACRSTTVIRGREDAQALHKLLSTQHQLISTKTGPQAGLPPTLISHSPFRHSKQSELTMNSQLIKKGSQVKYVMEMERGPILPSTVELLFDFVHRISDSSSTSAPPNRVKLQLIGRSQCNGINEALNKEAVNDGVGGTQQHQFVNCNELEWDGRQFEFL